MGAFDFLWDIVEIVAVIGIFIVVWFTLAIMGAIGVDNADKFVKDLKKNLGETSPAYIQANKGYNTLVLLEVVTWIGFALFIIFLILLVLFEIFGGEVIEGAAAVTVGGVEATEAGVVAIEGAVGLEAAAATDLALEVGAESAAELEAEESQIRQVYKQYDKYRGKAKDELLKSKSKYDSQISSESGKISGLGKSCKYGLYWDKYFFNFNGLFNILRTLVFDLSTFALFILGFEFASAATDLGQAGNKAVKEGYAGANDQPKGDVESGWAAFISITPFIIILVWGIAHIIYKYFVKCPGLNEETKKLLETEKALNLEVQVAAKKIEEEEIQKKKIKKNKEKERKDKEDQIDFMLAQQGKTRNIEDTHHEDTHHKHTHHKKKHNETHKKSGFHVPFFGKKSTIDSNPVYKHVSDKVSTEAIKHADTLISKGSDYVGAAISKTLSSV